jgi:carbonic anhydrase
VRGGGPFVREAVAAGRLHLHGWYFDLDGGELLGCDPATGSFELFVKDVAGRPASRHTTQP